jgi:flagellar biosynthesis protein FlhB
MAAVVLVALPVWFRATVSAAVAAIENIQMTGEGGNYHIFLPLIFPTIVVVALALGVLLLVRTLFDGAAWRIDRLVFRFERIDPEVGLQRIVSATTVVRACFLLLVLQFLSLRPGCWQARSSLFWVILPASLGRGAGQGSEVLSAAVNYLWGMLAVASIVSALDWWLQRFRFERKIRMTPSELREELRSLRANPKVRWQRNG